MNPPTIPPKRTLDLAWILQCEALRRCVEVPFPDCLRYARIICLFGLDRGVIEEFLREFGIPDRQPPNIHVTV